MSKTKLTLKCAAVNWEKRDSDVKLRFAHPNSVVRIQKYICAAIDVERACVKGETLIPIIDKVSSASDMIEQTLCFAIHVPCITHNLFVTYSYHSSLTTSNEWHHNSYCSKREYLNYDNQKRFRICICIRTHSVLSHGNQQVNSYALNN